MLYTLETQNIMAATGMLPFSEIKLFGMLLSSDSIEFLKIFMSYNEMLFIPISLILFWY